MPTMAAAKLTNRNLTTREQAFLETYTAHERKHGAPPSMVQMSRALGIAVNGAQYIRDRLVDKGFVTKIPIPENLKRSNTLVRLRLTAKGKKALP